MKALGVAADAAAWPALTDPSRLRRPGIVDWKDIETQWRRSLTAMAIEVRTGHAAVAPRDLIQTCRECGRQSLCRIGAMVGPAYGENGDG